MSAIPATPPGLFPFVLPWDDAEPGVADVSGLLFKPAGRFGHARAEADGHIYVGQGSERRRLRVFGVNLSFAANFPTREDAPKVAARLAKFGVNCVRFHHMDRDPAPKGLWQADMVTIDPEQLDRLDFFFAELKARGIHANLNLHVSRVYPGFPVWPGMSPFHKGVDIFHPGLVAMQRDYARALLHHRNPYTGLTYAEDPAVVFVEINNENGLVSRWWEKKLDDIPAVFADELARQWRLWRVARGLSADAPVVLRRDYEALPADAQRDWMRFLWETEKAYWADFQRHLKTDLGVRALVIGTQLYSYSAIPLQAEMDVIDIHAYWEHPEFPKGGGHHAGEWTVGNTSIVNSPDARTLADLSLQRVAGKPLVVTEYNHSAPNTYGAEAFLLVAAYGALQDWDGIFAYSYAHLTNRHWGNGAINGMFDIDQHPVKMATLPIAAALFHRADVAPTVAERTVAASEEQFLEICRRVGVNIGGDHFGALRHDALRRRQFIRLDPAGGTPVAPPSAAYAGPVASDGGELVWDAAFPNGSVLVNTSRVKMAVGFTDARALDLGSVSIRTVQGWSAIALAQMDDAPLGGSGRALLVAAGYVANTGMVWKNAEQNSLSDWGRAPTLVEGVPAEVAIDVGDRALSVWALDERGLRHSPVPVRVEGGRAVFSIGPEHRTLWYELDVA